MNKIGLKLSKEQQSSVLENILMILIIIAGIKKGGFYITDMNIISVLIIGISAIYCYIKIQSKKINVNKTHIFLILFSICYSLPLIFGKAVDSQAAVWEVVKYILLFCIYFVITNSSNKFKFEYLLIILGVIIGIFGIDGIASRIFSSILQIFNSGYLSTYLDRLSSFIQYANTAAILLMIAFLFAIKHVAISIKEVHENYIVQNANKTKLFICIASFLFMCILLTQSRLPTVLTIIGIILLCILNKENKIINLITIIFLVILALIFTSLIMEYIYIQKEYIYIIFAIFIIFSIILSNFIFYKVIINVKFWYLLDNIKMNKIKIICISCFISIISIIAIFSLTKDLIVSSNNDKLYIEREVKIKNTSQLQNIELKVKNISKDFEYCINVYEQKVNNAQSLVASFTHNSSDNNEFNIILRPEMYSKNYIFRFEVSSGKIQIDELKINDEKIKLAYLLIPSELTFRLKKELIGSVSTNVRIEYLKDSIKILKTSPLIGRGGEAFRNLYKSVQTQNYKSTEVHSSFVQILIESGILGFTCMILFIFFSLKNSKMDSNKVIYLLFILHSCLDLNFSYTISVIVFAILTSNLQQKIKNVLK